MLSEQRWDRSVIVPRLEQFAQVEGQALIGFLEKPEDVRMHSCGGDTEIISGLWTTRRSKCYLLVFIIRRMTLD